MTKVLQHIILWIAALSILNSSVDAIDVSYIFPQKNTVAPVDEYNQIESIVEFVVDEASNHQKSMPDQKGGNEQGTLKKTGSFELSLPVKKEKALSAIFINLSQRPVIINGCRHLPAGHTTIFSPPPNHT
jgi:hypothetical protein